MALIHAFGRSAPDVTLDANGYLAGAERNLVEGVRLADFEADLRQGDGNELEGKFRAAYSSCALAVNTFAPFKSKCDELPLPGASRFGRLSFARKCHHGLAGRKAPNLAVVAEGASEVVAIEPKCLEPLRPHIAEFAPAYDAQIRDWRRDTTWFREMLHLGRSPRAYRWLDAAQLVKHAFGVAHRAKRRRRNGMP